MSGRDQNHSRVIAIDGPAGAGKTTVARALATRIGAMLFDTGALYRSVTLAALQANIPVIDGPALARLALSSRISLRPPSVDDGRSVDVLLNGEDVTWAVRSAAVDAQVSVVAAHPEVRAALLPVQRNIADNATVVMVGRDIASVVIPDAGVKIYLDASVPERARRRALELRERGHAVDEQTIRQELETRDQIDSTRDHAPLVAAADAVIIDTDHLTIEQVVDQIAAITAQRWRTAES